MKHGPALQEPGGVETPDSPATPQAARSVADKLSTQYLDDVLYDFMARPEHARCRMHNGACRQIRKWREEFCTRTLKEISKISVPRELKIQHENNLLAGKSDEDLHRTRDQIDSLLAARLRQEVTSGAVAPDSKNNPSSFTEFTFPRYVAAPLHHPIASQRERVERGEIDRLMLLVPPRHGKSELASLRFPAWFL